jgi:proline racemase
MSKTVVTVIDAHVAGEPVRLVTGGPRLKGSSIVEKTEYAKQNLDFIRKAVMLEPRGHGDMYGAFLTEPADPHADLGVIFIDGGLYNAMCGHASIGIGTMAVETGMVKPQEPVTEVVLETGAGLVTILVDVEDGHARGATLQGVPSFLYREQVIFNVFDRQVAADIVYGGNFFAMVDMAQLGLKHSKEYLHDFVRYGLEIRKQANRLAIQHPELPHIKTVDDILFVGEPQFPGDTYKSLCFLGQAQIDRSPCGTGTSARMGALYAKGLLKEGDLFRHESIIGTVFEGRIGKVTSVGPYPAVIPLIRSKAFITGYNTLMIDTDDPLREGFLLR